MPLEVHVSLAEEAGGGVDDQGEREGGVLADEFGCDRRGAVAGPVRAEAAWAGPGRGHPEPAGQQAGVQRGHGRDGFRPVIEWEIPIYIEYCLFRPISGTTSELVGKFSSTLHEVVREICEGASGRFIKKLTLDASAAELAKHTN